jgi:hypothetical protein
MTVTGEFLTQRRDTLARHAKSHCVGRTNHVTLSETSTDPGEDTIMRNEEQSPGNPPL